MKKRKNSKKFNENIVNAGFWRRTFAIFIDFIILGLIGYLITYFFDDFFYNNGPNFWYIGFILSGIYFIIFDSFICKGQTIGKRLLRIRTVDNKGKFLKLSKAFYRYLFVGFIYFNSGFAIMFSNIFGLRFIVSILDLFLFFYCAVIIAFTIDKRGMHDYLTKSVVIYSKNKKDIKLGKLYSLKESFKKRKSGFISIFVFILLIILSMVITSIVLNSTDLGFGSMLNLKNSLEKDGTLKQVSITTQKDVTDILGNKQTTKTLIVSGYIPIDSYNDDDLLEKEFNTVHEQILKKYSDINEFNSIKINLETGYNIGLYGKNDYQTKTFSIG